MNPLIGNRLKRTSSVGTSAEDVKGIVYSKLFNLITTNMKIVRLDILKRFIAADVAEVNVSRFNNTIDVIVGDSLTGLDSVNRVI